MPADDLEWEIRRERVEDGLRILALTGAGFGPGRYAKSAYRLREGVKPLDRLGFVAVENAVLRGSVRFWPIRIGEISALLLGPLAVEGAQRGRGIGISLMQRGIAAARDEGWRAILLVGDEPYYGRVGFQSFSAGAVTFPGPVDPARLLGLALDGRGLEVLQGPVRRGPLEDTPCADGAPAG
ncbi:MAG: GNAT family N-acetyltransferase [Rhizomicrobium sp.]